MIISPGFTHTLCVRREVCIGIGENFSFLFSQGRTTTMTRHTKHLHDMEKSQSKMENAIRRLRGRSEGPKKSQSNREVAIRRAARIIYYNNITNHPLESKLRLQIMPPPLTTLHSTVLFYFLWYK